MSYQYNTASFIIKDRICHTQYLIELFAHVYVHYLSRTPAIATAFCHGFPQPLYGQCWNSTMH